MRGAYKHIAMKDEQILSGSQLRQYLHISTRKMKYLMDHDIIPHNNTGQATHKYEIKKSDADAYLKRLKADPTFMVETKGLFTSRKSVDSPSAPAKMALKIDSETVKNSFVRLWIRYPEILSSRDAAEMIGSNRQFIRRKVDSGEIKGALVRGSLVCMKSSLINYVSAPERIAYPPTVTLKEILQTF